MIVIVDVMTTIADDHFQVRSRFPDAIAMAAVQSGMLCEFKSEGILKIKCASLSVKTSHAWSSLIWRARLTMLSVQ